MICEVNGEPTPTHWICYREPGFGSPVELPLYPYTLKYDINELRDSIDEDANAFVQVMKLDFEQTGDPYPQYLFDLGYPSVEILAQHDWEFSETIRRYLYSELFGHSFPWTPPYQDVRWIINSIESVRSCGGIVEVLGQAFRKVENYQDTSR
jgi:hypothetical protein